MYINFREALPFFIRVLKFDFGENFNNENLNEKSLLLIKINEIIFLNGKVKLISSLGTGQTFTILLPQVRLKQ